MVFQQAPDILLCNKTIPKSRAPITPVAPHLNQNTLGHTFDPADRHGEIILRIPCLVVQQRYKSQGRQKVPPNVSLPATAFSHRARRFETIADPARFALPHPMEWKVTSENPIGSALRSHRIKRTQA